ncbi:conjugal transfer protein TraD [Legionella pneumophila serogroup 1]|uniref:conjugal transfer protein TraD n=1 Tax=Legionella pneumophila TaxID=446 RepID=UPI001020E5EC|nr:conjugal transfer protein TraD [Legionella pneumophila]RYX26742.1 conjugal transfer protein TraD [Legionella pneumophila]HEM0470651.1 conjugal transfer protein TraD [Legionella pneumophila]
MTVLEEIEKEKQLIARCEKSLALEKLKKRRADTRRKIELGGLVIKSGFSCYDKTVILGALNYALELIHNTESYRDLYETRGKSLLYHS